MMTRRVGIMASFLMGSVLAVGCGDNLITAAQKITNGQICQLSTNEIKALNQAAITLGGQQTPPVTVPTLTDAQAAALSQFAAQNNLCTQDDLRNLQTRIKNGPPLVGLEELATAFGSLDPKSVDANGIAMIFKQFIGG